MTSGRRRLPRTERIAAGHVAARAPIAEQDALWSRHSNDKIDIGRMLVGVLQELFRGRPPRSRLRALSVGSSTEPQFRILQAACAGGLHLLDIDDQALSTVRERVQRQHIDGVSTVVADFTAALRSRSAAKALRHDTLGGSRMGLLTFHHSLYYAPRSSWDGLLDAAWTELLERPRSPRTRSSAGAAIHAVLMSHRSDLPTSTTAIYNHWAGRFFGAHNDQDLAGFGRSLRRSGALAGASVRIRTNEVVFDADDFGEFMRCVWMILLHPQVHHFDDDQQAAVTEWIYANLWSKGVPLTQFQDHLILTR